MDKSRRGFFGKLAAGAAAAVLPAQAETAKVSPKPLGEISVKTAHDFRVGVATAVELSMRGVRLESPEAPVIPGKGMPHTFVNGYCRHDQGHALCPDLVWDDERRGLVPCTCSCHQEARGRDSR